MGGTRRGEEHDGSYQFRRDRSAAEEDAHTATVWTAQGSTARSKTGKREELTTRRQRRCSMSTTPWFPHSPSLAGGSDRSSAKDSVEISEQRVLTPLKL